VGQALVSAVDATTVIVTRAPEAEAVLTCGGVEMAPAGEAVPEGAEADPAQLNGTRLGKRYADKAGTIEVLCTKAGDGTLALDGQPLGVQQAKPLPASD
jgi:hypothetical protein